MGLPKARHGLTKRAVDNKDKHNYSSIAMLVDEKVEACLNELSHKFKTYGTVVYITIMRSIRDATFDKSLAPITRIYLVWFSLYFLRIWRTWLNENGYTESDHFVTQNAYLCVEINAHMIINTVVNVK